MTPETLAPGEAITRDGAYIVPIERYHRDPFLCDGPSISSTGLRKIWDYSPAHYWVSSKYNPERLTDGDKPAFAFGRLAHSMLLEGKLPANAVAKAFADYRTKDAQQWRDDQIAAGRTIIDPDDLTTIRAMANALRADPDAYTLLTQAATGTEVTYAHRDPDTGVWLLARPDVVALGNCIVDYKTTRDARVKTLARTIINYGYHLQLALGRIVVEGVTKSPVENCALVLQETAAPHAVQCCELSDALLDEGRKAIRAAITRFAECAKAGTFPAYVGGIIPIAKPDWMNELPETE